MNTETVEVHHVAEGPPDAPLVVLSGSLGSTLAMWEPQAAALAARYRVVRYDTRGHGGSPVPPGPYRLADLGGDVLRLLDRLGAERAHFAGVSLGGMTGMWLAAHAPERIDRLALVCTSARMRPQDWAARAATVRESGVGAIADAVVDRWITPGYAEREPGTARWMREMVAATPAEGYAGCCAAIEHMDLRGDLPHITAPTLVVGGSADPAMPPEHARAIAERIPGAHLRALPGAHLASWECAVQLNDLLLAHFGGAALPGAAGAGAETEEAR
ncbi:3-oxoadipate enol-lactonase [Streptomonospora nanhaiensis]|uniref:3-oxoadipate enol-lactonase n=1 Tax=Streptomonospora nanhaiensis TaxID=1323731 RepID=UPI001C990F23|nr:3-oxoadipate enol-lactonase [Streptomonospora nanhaiensis]MBX9387042.1 3-oxoadipate enol-lactonase [Streptomonospora nanhaiensis]